jgi:hypothetical protein
MTALIDFFGIKAAALRNGRSLLMEWLPGGKFDGREYVVRNPTRSDKNPGSFKINLQTGKWADWADNSDKAKGGDLTSLYAYINGVSQGEAALEIAEMLGISTYRSNGSKGDDTKPPPKIYSYGEEGPPVEQNEIRRHYYPKYGTPKEKIKIKKRGSPKDKWANCYRVFQDGAPVGWQWAKPNNYRDTPYFGAVRDLRPIFWTEGERDADTLDALKLPVFTYGGVGDGLPDRVDLLLSKIQPGRLLIIPADNDAPGRSHAQKKAELAHAAGVERIRIFDVKKAWPECPEGGDVTDWFERDSGTVEKLQGVIDAVPDWRPSADTAASAGFGSFDSAAGSRFSEWRQPQPLPKGLPPVAAFDPDFLPDAIAPWVMDITNRMQCQLDNVAVAAMTALGAVIGRRVGIKPQMNTDWVEVPNIWGATIGRPGLIKSGAQNAGVGPLHHLEAEAAKKNAAAMQAYEAELEDYKLRQQVDKQFKKDALKGEDKQLLELGAEPTPPADIRYRTNDTSYESLGELLVGNSTGILVERDELISLLQHLDRDDQANARGFYLSGWSGQLPYTFDRIIRGHRHIEAVCISVLGNTQPARISEYVRRANLGGAGGDGLIQRFGLLVWPDVPPEWRNVDVQPDGMARQRVWSIFEQISKIDASEAHRLGATQDKFDKNPAFRFTDAAHAQFLEWREELERRLRSGELSPALEGHLSKYRKLVPGLALINHMADSKQGNIDVREVLRAIAYAEYLETHAKRVYSSASESETAAAQAILRHIRKGDLKDGFTVRDVHRPRWSNLTEHEQVANGLNLLVDFGYLAETELCTKPQGGRPKIVYAINPGLQA